MLGTDRQRAAPDCDSCRALCEQRKKREGACYETASGECDRRARLAALKVPPEAADALRLFSACLTQMRIAPMGGPIGFDYAAVALVAGTEGIELPDVFAYFRVLENAYLAELRKKQRKS